MNNTYADAIRCQWTIHTRIYPLPMNNAYADNIRCQLTIHTQMLSAANEQYTQTYLPPRKKKRKTQKNTAPCRGKELCGSATGIRTPVYGVRGRCPRPLDDSTIESIKQRRKCEASEQSMSGHQAAFLNCECKGTAFFWIGNIFEQKNAKKRNRSEKKHGNIQK